MGILKDKIEKLAISDNAKAVLNACIDEEHSILSDRISEGLYRTMIRDVKNDNSMLSFLMSLADDPDDRYIKLPHYTLTHKRKLKANEMVLDEYGKYGILLNIVSNKKSFNFSVRLKDMTIVKFNYELKKQERGSFRSFTLTDKFGNISDNWKVLKVFQMHETKHIFDNHDRHDKRIYNVFVGDQLANQLLNIKYFLLKCYINRLVAERNYWQTLKEKAIERIESYDAQYEYDLIKQELAEREGDSK